MIKTFIFDLGGVVLTRGLWDFREYLVNNYSVTDQQTIDVFIRKYYKPYFSGKMSENDFWEGVLKDLDISADWMELKNILLNFYLLQDDVVEIIKDLRNSGYTVTLLSDQTNDRWPYLDKKYSISSLFDHVVISSRVGLHKPDSKVYEYALTLSGALPSETIFVDDLEKNLLPANNLGISTLLFVDSVSLKTDLHSFLSA